MKPRDYFHGTDRVREVFERIYPVLTDEQIQAELEAHPVAGDPPKAHNVALLQAFYKHVAFEPVASALGLSLATVCHAVEDAAEALPVGSKVRHALQLAYSNRNVRQE